jgi:hypothetical protein
MKPNNAYVHDDTGGSLFLTAAMLMYKHCNSTGKYSRSTNNSSEDDQHE